MLEQIKQFAWQQMDAMWHDNSGLVTQNMVKFEYKGYCVVNPWMDEKTQNSVNPYEYYGKGRTDYFIKEVEKRLKHR